MTDPLLMTHLVEGAGALAALVLAYVGVRISRNERRLAARQWRPLAPLVNGRPQGTALAGTYAGMAALARIVSDGDAAFFYELSLSSAPGGGNWQALVTGQKFLGTGDKAWRVKSADADLAKHLTDAGVVSHVQTLPADADVSYTAKAGALLLRAPASGPLAVPTPEAFRVQLEQLSALMQINARVNT